MKENKKIRVIRISDFDEYDLKDNKVIRIDENKKYDNYVINNNSILLAMTGGTVGKSCLLSNLTEKMYLNQRVASINCQYSNISIIYLYYVIKSPFIKDVIRVNKNSTNDNISMDLINNFIIPTPPFEEQQHIVKKIESILSYIERYDNTYSRLESLNSSYKEDLKKSILQYAIQGKLVKQELEDESAEVLINKILDEKRKLIKTKQLKKENLSVIYKDSTDNQFYEKFDDGKIVNITDEIPFDIPYNWAWTRIGNIAFVTKLAGFEYTKYMSNAISSNGEIPIVRARNIKDDNFIDNIEEFISSELSEQLNRCALYKPAILMTFIGAGIGDVAIFNKNARYHLAPNVAKIELYNNNIIQYILYYLISYTGKSEVLKFKKSTAQPSLSMQTIREVLVPLPSLSEINLISNKIKQILKEVA